MEDAMTLEQIAADIDALVTGDEAERLEQLVAGQLVRRERGRIAAEPPVEAAFGGRQRPLVSGDGIQESRTIRLAPIGIAKLTREIRDDPDPRENVVDGRAHDSGIFQQRLR